MARPSKCRCICSMPQVTEFLPRGAVPEAGESVVLQVDELEAIRLLDYRGFTQEQCAARMNISRATVARIYEEGRRKVAQAPGGGTRAPHRGRGCDDMYQPPARVRRGTSLLPQAGKGRVT